MTSPPLPAHRVRAALGALVLAAALAACGVEVPDDVAAQASSTSTATEPGPSTTEAPTSDDELEQALIDNGYTLDESRCGAENLRTEVDEDEIQEIIDADTIEDIDPGTAADFATALRDCVEDGADDDGGRDDDDGEGDDDDGPPDEDDAPDDDGGMPDIGDDSEGDVSRSRFLSGLLSAGVPDGEARCIVDGVFEEFDQETINRLFQAGSAEDLPPDLVDAYRDVVRACR